MIFLICFAVACVVFELAIIYMYILKIDDLEGKLREARRERNKWKAKCKKLEDDKLREEMELNVAEEFPVQRPFKNWFLRVPVEGEENEENA